MANDRRFLYPSIRKYNYLIALTVSFSLLAAVFEGFSIGMLIPFLQTLSDDTESFKVGIEWIDQTLLGAGQDQLTRMYHICAIILVATWLRTIFGYLGGVYGMEARVSIVEDLRLRIVDQLQAVSLRYFSTTRAGEILNTFTNEINRVSEAMTLIISIFSRGALLLVYTSFMVWVSWELSLLVMVCFGLLSLGLTFLVRTIRGSSAEISLAGGHFTSRATEFINGIRTVVAFNRQQFERKRLRKATKRFADSLIHTGRRSQAVEPISQLVFGTVLVVVVVLAVQFLVLPGVLDFAMLLAFLFALFRLVPIAHTLNSQRGQWASISGSVTNVADMLDSTNKPYQSEGTKTAPPLTNGIRFQNVDFEYEPGERILSDINLFVDQGKTTAIVGASGSGKSTLVDLIPRFHDPISGHILWDGTDLEEYRIASIRDRIAIVSQSTFIFNDTVEANIRYGNLDASFEQVTEAAREANALEFVEEMNDGFDTMLGDQGIRLSGGQRQRIAIARAILRDPEVLILDEATSALDSVSEKLVQESLERLMEGRTVIAIAHRLSTIENADWVAVLEDGEIVEQGTYDDLLEQRGHLWKYHSLQFDKAVPATLPQ
jgi:subfamily B ATP-binding cassette protein MsbA